MWIVANTTPYAADAGWVQDREARKIWLAAVKATYDIRPDGSTMLANEQVPVLRVPVHWSEPGLSSLRYDADLLGPRVATDVLLIASAWSASRRPVEFVDVGFRVGPIQKLMRVFGDRLWDDSLAGRPRISSPERFECMPIRFERAYGGWDRKAPDPRQHRVFDANPVGVGFITCRQAVAGTRLPNLEYPGKLIASWEDRPAPVAFGPVDCAWSPRREFAGTYDTRWLRERFPLWAEDFDARYHCSAAVDQQVSPFLRGGEPARLLRLSCDGEIAFSLPRVYLHFETRFGAKTVEHRANLTTVILEPDARRIILVWQSWLECSERVDELDVTIVREKRVA